MNVYLYKNSMDGVKIRLKCLQLESGAGEIANPSISMTLGLFIPREFEREIILNKLLPIVHIQ
jgi:hypothetical protein